MPTIQAAQTGSQNAHGTDLSAGLTKDKLKYALAIIDRSTAKVERGRQKLARTSERMTRSHELVNRSHQAIDIGRKRRSVATQDVPPQSAIERKLQPISVPAAGGSKKHPVND